jgi:sulfatase maturation enzyme AslB (radical SAM superfamily)
VDQQTIIPADEAQDDLSAIDVACLMLSAISDGLDHPELWARVPDFLDSYPQLSAVLGEMLEQASDPAMKIALLVLLSMCGAGLGQAELMRNTLAPVAADHSGSPLVQGALFYLDSLLDPENPKYRLQGKICATPFTRIDVLEGSSHLCCASWLPTSVGTLVTASAWQDVWNSEAAQGIRESIHDGSYRYCNKTACPIIQENGLHPASTLASQSSHWADILSNARTVLPVGPDLVNLSYDRTCNLSCPSCRLVPFAADEQQRASFDAMQEHSILPLLRDAKFVYITGSGDPFASKNFRRLMTQLTADEYPELRFIIMTNGMLFTPRQWESFPALHNRVHVLKISIDAATGPTHELLRRGARWPVVLENMKYAGELVRSGAIDGFELVFTVQSENYREMGDAVDLAREVGATSVYFGMMTNWGTFTPEDYRAKAVFNREHPHFEDFIEAMQDIRLQRPEVILGNLRQFVATSAADTGASHRVAASLGGNSLAYSV